MTIRQYVDSDAEPVRSLHQLALEDAGGFIAGPWDQDLERIREVYLDSGGEFLVGLIDGKLVAMGGLLLSAIGDAEIKRMRVHPDHQRCGLGTQILHALEKRAESSGCHRLFLDTTSSQIAAQRLYERNGYREFDRKPWRDIEMIYYEKVLT